MAVLNSNSLLFPEILTEKTVAELFTSLFGYTTRFDHKRHRWLIWNIHYWEEDRTEDITRLVFTLSDLMKQEGEETNNKNLRDWGIKLQNNAKIKNIISLAKAIKPIPITGDEFDTQKMLLGVKNGIIDLETGKLRNGKTNDYINFKSPVNFDANAICPKWETFIEKIFLSDKNLIDYVQRALGYSITASTGEQVFFICHGEGGNGKSILFKVISKILGDYAHSASSNLFKKNQFYTNTNDIADIDRKRFIVNAETIKDTFLDEEKLKSITGGDKITARRLHENNLSFYPVAKVWLHTNSRPKFEDDSYGLWRRVRVIDFPYKFSSDETILEYDEILFNEEAPGILNWLTTGCLMWQEKKLKDIPKTILQATEDYKIENNPLTEFLNERVIKEEGESLLSSTFYAHYIQWCSLHKKNPLTLTAFGLQLKNIGLEKKEVMQGTVYLNIRLVFV